MSDEPKTERPDWDFYLCRVEDAPASILVDLSLDRAAERPGTTLYVVRIVMGEPGDHGMGEGGELAILGPLEDRLVTGAAEHGARFVGRLRNRGMWQVTFMGPSGIQDAMGNLGLEVLDGSGRDHDLAFQEDPTWSWFDGLMYPDAERKRWILDRRKVQALREAGDDLRKPRRVDHRLILPGVEARIAAAGEAIDLGFGAVDPEPGDERGLRLFREDPVELDHIHAVAMGLSALAARHEGDYDGWEAPVVG